MRTNHANVLLLLLAASGLALSCGTLAGNPEGHGGASGPTQTPTTAPKVTQDKPADTNGQNGGMGLAIASGLSLTADATLKVNDTITLTYARLQVTSIGIYGAKDETPPEAQNHQALDAAQGSSYKAMTAIIDKGEGTGLHLDGGGNGSGNGGGSGNGNGNGNGTGDANGNGTGNANGNSTGNANGNGTGNGDNNGNGHSHHDQDVAKAAAIVSQLSSLQGVVANAQTSEDSADPNIKFAGPLVYDAVAGSFTGTAASVQLPDGSYHRIEFTLQPYFPSQAPSDPSDPLIGNVFAIQGTVTLSGTSVPFQIAWDSALNFLSAGDAPFALTADQNNVMAIVFDVTKWFDGVDLSTATVDPDGTIYIDRNTNQAIMKTLRHNITLNVTYGKAGADGQLKASDALGTGDDRDADENADAI